MSTLTITEPGIVPVMPEETYHSDPVPGGSLSSSGAKTLLRSPAHYQWERKHRTAKTTYDVGHAAHAKILGVGSPVVAYPDEHLTPSGNASTKGASVLWAEDQRKAGLIPVTPNQIAAVDEMAEAVLDHTLARRLLERPGVAEASLFGPDPETGVWLRARPDFLPDRTEDRTLIGDLKTAVSADPRTFQRSVAEYGYSIQSEFYQELVRQVRGDDDTAFLFIVVEKAAPHFVSVNAIDEEFAEIGRRQARRAIDLFHQCRESGQWPGYPEVIHYIEPPRWFAIQSEQEDA